MFGFFIMGFVDIVGIATSYVKSDFAGLSDSVVNMISLSCFLWFLVLSIPTGMLMNRIGRKNTVLLVSHSMEDIAQYAKKVLVIAEGKPAMYDTVENIFSRVEELTAMGLAVPQISRVFAGLRAAGYQVPGNIYTVEGAAAAILNAVKGGAAR